MAAAAGPSAARGSATTMAGRPADAAAVAPAASVSTATAPAPAAAGTKEAPCARAPGSAANRSPGRTSLLAWVTPVTATPGGVAPDLSERPAEPVAPGAGAPGAGTITAPSRRAEIAASGRGVVSRGRG